MRKIEPIDNNSCKFYYGDSFLIMPLSEDKFRKHYRLWLKGDLIQHAFPMLNEDQREFIMTGMSPEQWEQINGYWQ